MDASVRLFRCGRRISTAVVLALCLPQAHAATPAPPICDGSAILTLVGIDTSTGRTLFSLPATNGKASWLVELDGDGREARAWPDNPKGRFSGSVGPGPVLAVVPCGASCLQPVRWQEGSWEPVGESISAPATVTVNPTYDQTGAPWFLLLREGGAAGQAKAWAFRLEGSEWRNRGSMTVAAVGQPSTLPAPQRKDGVLVGTGLFSASGPPQTWVSGLPGITTERRGQIIALTGTAAAYLSGDGIVYLSPDSGKSWRRSTWTPWASNGMVGIWRQGHDFWIDFPFGDSRGSLRLVWFDRRRPSEEILVLTRLTQKGDWVHLAEVPGEVKTKSNEHLPVTQILVPQGDTWILLSGCAATAQGSGLVLRIFDGNNVSEPRFVPLKMK